MAGMHRKSIEAADTLRSDNEGDDTSSHASDNERSSPCGQSLHQQNNVINESSHNNHSALRAQEEGDSSIDGQGSFSDSSRSAITSDLSFKNKVTKKGGKGSKKTKNVAINNRSPSPASSRYSVDSIVHGSSGHHHNGQQQQPTHDHRAHSIAALRARAMEHSAKVLQSLDGHGHGQLTESQAQALFYHRHHQGHHPPPTSQPTSTNVQVSPYSFQMSNNNNPTVRPIY